MTIGRADSPFANQTMTDENFWDRRCAATHPQAISPYLRLHFEIAELGRRLAEFGIRPPR